jgi:hypothetical protein
LEVQPLQQVWGGMKKCKALINQCTSLTYSWIAVCIIQIHNIERDYKILAVGTLDAGINESFYTVYGCQQTCGILCYFLDT